MYIIFDIKKMTSISEQLKSMKHGESLVEELADGGLVLSNAYNVESYTCIVCQTTIAGSIITCAKNMDSSRCMTCYIKMNECPMCRSREVFRNVLLERAVAKLQISCENNGCKFRGLIGDVKNHSVRCDRIDIKCFECEKDTTPFDLNSHLLTECPMRYVEFDIADIDKINHATEIRHLSICEDKTIYLRFTVQIFAIQLSDKKMKNSFVKLIYDGCDEPIHVPMNDNKSLECGFISSITIPSRKFSRWNNIKVSGFDTSTRQLSNGGLELMSELIRDSRINIYENNHAMRPLPERQLFVYDNNVSPSYTIERLVSLIGNPPASIQLGQIVNSYEARYDDIPELIEDITDMREVE